MSTRLQRQYDIVKAEELEFPIHIIGCGGIGSWVALLAAKMGCSNIYLYDDDIVEDHNIASQFFLEVDNNRLKRDALQENIAEQSGMKTNPYPNKMEENIKDGLVIMAVDSMEERIRLAEIYKDRNIFIIDGRMGGLQLEIYCNDAATYDTTLVKPEDVEHDLCTARAISFNCAAAGSLIVNFIRKYAKQELKNCNLIFDFNNVTLLRENL